MLGTSKPADALTVDDLKRHPVSRFVNDDSINETAVQPIAHVPVTSLDGKLAGTQVRLANGTVTWAVVGNVVTSNPRLTRHFREISLERNGQWFHLARYHDYDCNERGPDALAQFLGLSVDQVFPIAVDLRQLVRCTDPTVLMSDIELNPSEQLSRKEVIALAVP
jgi:hypothetical protein